MLITKVCQIKSLSGKIREAEVRGDMPEIKKLSEEFKNVPGSIGGNLFVSRFLQSCTKSIKVLTQDSQINEIEVEDLSLKRHIILSAVFRIKAKE